MIGIRLKSSNQPSMYPYSYFEPRPADWVTTFAYWICLLSKPLPKETAKAEALQSVMSFHYDVEEQAYKPDMLRSNKELIPKYLRPVAPVTLTYRWTPFELGVGLLGSPIEHGADEKSAYCIWKPEYLGHAMPEQDDSEHKRHALFLFRLAASAAIASKTKILVVGSPGWSVENQKNCMINPDTSLLMLESGYLYTERIPR